MSHRSRTAHLGLYDTLADWEVGHLLAELRRLGLASACTLEAYERLFDRGDATAFPVLAEAQST